MIARLLSRKVPSNNAVFIQWTLRFPVTIPIISIGLICAWKSEKWDLLSFLWWNFLKIDWLLATYNSYQIAYFCFSMSELMEYSKKNEKLENIGRSTWATSSFYHFKRSSNIILLTCTNVARMRTFFWGKVKILRYQGQKLEYICLLQEMTLPW